MPIAKSETPFTRLRLSIVKLAFPALLYFLLFPSLSWGDQAFPRENAIVKAARKVSPAVVNISTSKLVERDINPFSLGRMMISLIDFSGIFLNPAKDNMLKTVSALVLSLIALTSIS